MRYFYYAILALAAFLLLGVPLAGPDVMILFNGDDFYDGGSDTDTLTYSKAPYALSASLKDSVASGPSIGDDKIVNIENLTGGQSRDWLQGDDGPNVMKGLSGDDEIHALGGADEIEGGPGNDTLLGGSGPDTYRYAAGDGWDQIVETPERGIRDWIIIDRPNQGYVIGTARRGQDLVVMLSKGFERSGIIVRNVFPHGTKTLSVVVTTGGKSPEMIFPPNGTEGLRLEPEWLCLFAPVFAYCPESPVLHAFISKDELTAYEQSQHRNDLLLDKETLRELRRAAIARFKG